MRSHLLGPYAGAEEEVTELPYRRYIMGTLYPRGTVAEVEQDDEIRDEAGGSLRDELSDDPLVLANEWLPSSIGISLYFRGEPNLDVSVEGASYEAVDRNRWKRRPLGPETITVSIPAEAGTHATSVKLFDGLGTMRVRWRSFSDGWLVTVSLLNPAVREDAESMPDPEACLHQVQITVATPLATILEYPSVDLLVDDPEDEELALLHRDAKVYAVGHGCAATWSKTGDQVGSVSTEFVPRHEVFGLTFELEGDQRVLRLSVLSDPEAPKNEVLQALRDFVQRYETWIELLPAAHADLPSRLRPARDRLLRRLRSVARRMQSGVAALEDDEALLAFRLANLAMLMQMRHSEESLAGTRRTRVEAIDPTGATYNQMENSWRPFQLAFFLLVLPSLINEEDPDREIVDLLWFPTGGGKTEAYLAIAAFVLLLRRLRHGEAGSGTAVITRYTLRLLATQQFQRSATLLCALEKLRRGRPVGSRLGAAPFTIGVWLGDEVSPNKWTTALERFEEMRESSEPENPFQLEKCPWCGTEIVPRQYSEDDETYGVRPTASSFAFFCPNQLCDFHDELPVQVVDQSLYQSPPSFLLGTVDKFARLAWEADAGSFFGDDGVRPPDLVIQDELHLLSGPLGTLAGVYERAVDALIELRGGSPKIVASTATIRRADEQVRRLFARDVSVFPPAGLSADDSYFSRTDRHRPGRLYVGVMSQSHTSSTSLIQTSTALLLAPVETKLRDPVRDGYWTLVAYHNTLRELGRSVTQFRDDVPEMLRARAVDQANARTLDDDAVVELTGNVSGKRLPSLLERLFEAGESPQGVGVLATTNMLSVGVDVPRLGLMLVVGQPKSTSEYIQATSRVGRGPTPGLVVTMLSATKPRDRSHYEGFIGYHQSLYRSVEPTSVTPFSVPARARALHAALVILIRHGAGLSANRDAGRFRTDDPAVARAVTTLTSRFTKVDPEAATAAVLEVDQLVADWSERAQAALEAGVALHYSSGTPQLPSLLRNFGARGDGWETQQSMRNVDRQCWVDVLGSGG